MLTMKLQPNTFLINNLDIGNFVPGEKKLIRMYAGIRKMHMKMNQRITALGARGGTEAEPRHRGHGPGRRR